MKKCWVRVQLYLSLWPAVTIKLSIEKNYFSRILKKVYIHYYQILTPAAAVCTTCGIQMPRTHLTVLTFSQNLFYIFFKWILRVEIRCKKEKRLRCEFYMKHFKWFLDTLTSFFFSPLPFFWTSIVIFFNRIMELVPNQIS